MENVTVVPDYNSLSDLAAERIISCLSQKPNAVVCLAGGNTPLGTYEKLIEKIAEHSLDLSCVTFVGLDEWIGLNGSIKGSCRQTLDEHLYKLLRIAESQILFFDGMASNIKRECERILFEINRLGGLDFILLGVGVNGHIGFNEPNVPMDKYIHVVPLDEVTREVSGKYFDSPVDVSRGITLGMKLILSANEMVVIANGPKKADIIKQTLLGPEDPLVPSSLLRNLNNVEFIIDKEAAKEV